MKISKTKLTTSKIPPRNETFPRQRNQNTHHSAKPRNSTPFNTPCPYSRVATADDDTPHGRCDVDRTRKGLQRGVIYVGVHEGREHGDNSLWSREDSEHGAQFGRFRQLGHSGSRGDQDGARKETHNRGWEEELLLLLL